MTSAAESQTGEKITACCCKVWMEGVRGRNWCFDSYQGVKKELTKWGHLSHAHTYIGNVELLGFQCAAQARHVSSQTPQDVTCLSCFKGQTFDHISNPTHSGTMNQGFRSWESDFNFPKFPKRALAYFFFFI